MDVTTTHWLILVAAIAALFAFDFVLAGRRTALPSMRLLLAVNLGWALVGLSFGAAVLAWFGGSHAQAYVTGYVVERSLSLDNVAVFALLFSALALPDDVRDRVLSWGISLALGLRIVLILAGTVLMDRFSWIVIVFGAFLLWTAWRMRGGGHEAIDPRRTRAYRLLTRVVPVSDDPHHRGLIIRSGGRWMATPVLLAFLLVAVLDMLFAVDSVPAILAVTEEPYLVVAANAFALLGLRPLFFLLDGALRSIEELQQALALVLAWIGVKLVISPLWHVPAWLSLSVIVVLLGQGIVRAVLRQRREAALEGAAA